MNVLDNRELSWLAFNERVLAESEREDVPLLERLRFAGIFASNLEEFFMVRTGVLINRRLADDSVLDPRTRLSPSGQLSRIYTETRRLAERARLSLIAIENALAAEKIFRLRPSSLNDPQKAFADIFFSERIAPALTVSQTGDEPFIAGGRVCAACIDDVDGGGLRFALLPTDIPRLAALPCEDGFAYILTEDILAAHMTELFGGGDCALISVTRSADISADDLPPAELPYTDAVRQTVNLRSALPAVRLRLSGGASERLRSALRDYFSLEDDRIFTDGTPLDMGYVSDLAGALGSRTELFYPPFAPHPAEEGSVIDAVLEGDILLSYPYESFDRFLMLLEQAADDSRTSAIKITLYRTAKGSRVAKALCRAAENGKDVTVCVELKARFDEKHNIETAEMLSAAGCRVICGMRGIKVHSKLCLITLGMGGEMIRITQIGTGNYNESTAAQYTDLSLITADAGIAADAENVFTALCESRLPDGAYSLLVSPVSLKERVLALLDEEIAAADSGAAAYFGAKLNGLTDRDMIARLVEASKHGVRIELVVRGICCLRPGVQGMTENIRVISIVGRYLEHARIYIFGSGRRQRVYISSADLMTRNTCRRIEAAAPVTDKVLRKRLTDYFAAQLADTADAWEKLPDGSYARVPCGGEPFGSQQRFMEEQGYNPSAQTEAANETVPPEKDDTPSADGIQPEEPAEVETVLLEKDDTASAIVIQTEEPAAAEAFSLEKNDAVNANVIQTEEPAAVETVSLEKNDTANAGGGQTEESISEKPAVPEAETENDGSDNVENSSDGASYAELPPAPPEPQKLGFFARIASFFRRLGKK